jgi:hypothetical protein
MDGAPSSVSPEQLRDLSLSIDARRSDSDAT